MFHTRALKFVTILQYTTPSVLVVEQSPTPLYAKKLGHSSRYCDHSSKLSSIDMTLCCWDASRKSSGVLLLHFHHHMSTSRNTYSLLHLCPHIISSNLPSPLTMAEPSSVRRKSGWNSLPTEVIKLIVSRVDSVPYRSPRARRGCTVYSKPSGRSFSSQILAC